MRRDWTIVLDIGKTFAKATLWTEAGDCVVQKVRPNEHAAAHARPVLDANGVEGWLEAVLREFGTLGPVGAIVPVAHGAAAALIQRGRLACAPVDYEWNGVAVDRANYDAQRDPFEATGSPALPAGLNLGMQLHWIESEPSEQHHFAQILPWAQYWAWLLSGVAASEVTSLGCHTDLWRPYARAPSELAVRRGWAERLAPLQSADAVLDRLAPTWVRRTRLSPCTDVYCGLHDSNAALLAARTHPAMRDHDTTVLSTGTWFVAMRSPRSSDRSCWPALPEARDCLVNVDVLGSPIPSSRFMGGREFELLVGNDPSGVESRGLFCSDDVRSVIESGELILPGIVPGVGPFASAGQRVVTQLPQDERARALAYLYVALVADVALDLIGSCDTLFIEGRFAQACIFVQALAALRPDTTVLIGRDTQGVARGALQLVLGAATGAPDVERVSPVPLDLTAYRARWREAVNTRSLCGEA